MVPMWMKMARLRPKIENSFSLKTISMREIGSSSPTSARTGSPFEHSLISLVFGRGYLDVKVVGEQSDGHDCPLASVVDRCVHLVDLTFDLGYNRFHRSDAATYIRWLNIQRTLTGGRGRS